MIIYFRGHKNGYSEFQAFHKIDTAIGYVISQIETWLAGGSSNYSHTPKKKKTRAVAVPALDMMVGVAPPAPQQVIYAQQPVPPPIQQPQPYFQIEPPPNNIYFEPYQFGNDQPTVAVAPKTIEKKATPKELKKLHEQIEVAKKNRTLKNTVELINIYEEYNSSILGDENVIHTLQEVKVAE
jgi:hypothetical protein